MTVPLSGASPEATPAEPSAALAEILRATSAAAERLAEAGARDEALAAYRAPRRRALVFTQQAALLPAGRAWRLGPLLLLRDGGLAATGETTRAVDPRWPGHQSVLAERRREFRGAAFRGDFAPGETVNYGWEPIELDAEALRRSAGPLFLDDRDRALVRWSRSLGDAAALPLERFLEDRAGLLISPPEGA